MRFKISITNNGKLDTCGFVTADSLSDAKRLMLAVNGGLENVKIEEDNSDNDKFMFEIRRGVFDRNRALHAGGRRITSYPVLAGENLGRGFAG